MAPKKIPRKSKAPAAAADDAAAPMTPAQSEELKALSQRAADPEAFHASLTRGAAGRRIAALQARLAREDYAGVDRRPRT